MRGNIWKALGWVASNAAVKRNSMVPSLQKQKCLKRVGAATVFAASLCGIKRPVLITKAFCLEHPSVSESDSLIIEEADRLYGVGNNEDLYSYLTKFKTSSNSNILWRLARSARAYALESHDLPSSRKKELIYEAYELSKRAIELNDNCWASHKWFAITLGDVGDYEGTKMKISNAFLIREHLEIASKLNPGDATTLHCLGMWCWAFADMPGWQHTIASYLFATPPTATYKDAEKFFLQAERVEPNFFGVNLLMLGKCYKNIGDKKRAMLYFQRAIEYPAVSPDDKKAQKDAEKLLAEIVGK